HALRLQRIRSDLVSEADPAPLLAQVEDRAAPRLRDHGERPIELLSAVALERAKHLARHAFGVNAHEDVVSGRITGEDRYMFFREVLRVPEHHEAKAAVPGRYRRLGGDNEARATVRIDEAQSGHDRIL